MKLKLRKNNCLKYFFFGRGIFVWGGGEGSLSPFFFWWSYRLEPFRPIASYCPEPFRPITSIVWTPSSQQPPQSPPKVPEFCQKVEGNTVLWGQPVVCKPAQNGSTQSHGQPALTDIWEGFQTKRSYCPEGARTITSSFFKVTVKLGYIPSIPALGHLEVPKSMWKERRKERRTISILVATTSALARTYYVCTNFSFGRWPCLVE